MAIGIENDKHLFRTPVDLRAKPPEPLKILTVGSCLISGVIGFFNHVGGATGDYVLFNNVGQLPKAPPQSVESYDLQIVQIPVRSVIPDGSFESLGFDDQAAHQRLFEAAEDRLFQLLDAAMKWNKEAGLATLVVNFFQPQQSPMGRLLKWHDLRNIAYFIARLNESLERELGNYANAYILNFDEIAAGFGRKFVQDDVLWQFNHGAALNDNDFEPDQARLHPPARASEHYTLRIGEFLHAVYEEVLAMHRTLRGKDAVKLVIVDLDDTLWRGVIVEEGSISNHTLEGWPLGFVEALLYLKKRGLLLAIVSKNDDGKIRALWPQLFGQRLRLEDFAVIRINWSPKSENIEEVIREVNVLPGSVVFIDDNPVERSIAEMSTPGIRTLGADLYYLRRILLWAPEMQVATVTAESGRRTEMVQAQVERESTRKRMSREEFIASLNIQLDIFAIDDVLHPRFARALELINKSNQFNTTGKRWTLEETKAAFAGGTRFHAFEVTDKFTAYGLVGVAIVSADTIVQFVMSCRVIGLDVETRVLDHVVAEAQSHGVTTVTAIYTPSEKNNLCADLFERAGFMSIGDDRWQVATQHIATAVSLHH